MNNFLWSMKLILFIFVFVMLPGNAQQDASSWGERSQRNNRTSFATSSSAEMKTGSAVSWQPGKGQFGETWKSPIGGEPLHKSISVDVHSSTVKTSTSKSSLQHSTAFSDHSPRLQDASKKNKNLQKVNKSVIQHGKTYQSVK